MLILINILSKSNKESISFSLISLSLGLRAKTPGELDDKIIEMINTDKPVIFDCLVDKQENCFPMIPSGKPHNQMLLGPQDQKNKKITGKGKTLV